MGFCSYYYMVNSSREHLDAQPVTEEFQLLFLSRVFLLLLKECIKSITVLTQLELMLYYCDIAMFINFSCNSDEKLELTSWSKFSFLFNFLNSSKILIICFYLIFFFGFGFIYFSTFTIFLIIFLIAPQNLFLRLFQDLPGISPLIITHLAPYCSIFLNNRRSSSGVQLTNLGVYELNLTQLIYLSLHCFPLLAESGNFQLSIQAIFFQLLMLYSYFKALSKFYSSIDQFNLDDITVSGFIFQLQQLIKDLPFQMADYIYLIILIQLVAQKTILFLNNTDRFCLFSNKK